MIQKLLFIAGVACLGIWGFFTVQARVEQSVLEGELYLPGPPETRSTGGGSLRPLGSSPFEHVRDGHGRHRSRNAEARRRSYSRNTAGVRRASGQFLPPAEGY